MYYNSFSHLFSCLDYFNDDGMKLNMILTEMKFVSDFLLISKYVEGYRG